MEPTYFLALATGFLGGFGHCIGMCGPLVAASALHGAATGGERSIASRVVPQFLYHAGRLTTYAIVGAVMGLAGSFVNVATKIVGLQYSVMIISGVVMIIMGFGVLGFGTMAWLERHNTLVLRAAKTFFSGSSAARYYPLGLVLGLLPCGLSYTVFIAAAGTGTPLAGFLTMLLFGAGTVPALALFGVAISYFGSRMRIWVQRAGGIAVILLGGYYILKGIQQYAEM
jgi:uncharacterized protein